MRIPNVIENGNTVVNDSNSISSQYIINSSYLESDNHNLITNTDVNVQFNSNYNRFSNVKRIIDSNKSIIKEKFESKLYNEQYKLNNQKVDQTIIPSEVKNQNKKCTWRGNCIGE